MADLWASTRASRVVPLHTLPRWRDARMLRAPDAFDGTLEELARRYVLPNLPLSAAVERFHRQLVEYCREPAPLFLVRGKPDQRGHDYCTAAGDRFRVTDNAPAWAVHFAVFHEVALEEAPFSGLIDGLPTHRDDVLLATDRGSINAARWHVAHIAGIGDGDTDAAHWSRATLVRRFVRNVHPGNFFVVPLAQWRRYGGDQQVIAYFAQLYAERYSAIWPEFCALAQVALGAEHSDLGSFRYVYGPDQTSMRTGSPPVVQGATTDRPLVTYHHARLCFKADLIETLPPDGAFRVATNVGTFQMTKEEFHRDFPNVVASRSYRDAGVYHYPTLPKKAERYRVGSPT